MPGRKPARKLLAYKEAEKAKIWWNQQAQCQTRSLAPDLSDCGSHRFKLRRMVKGTRVEDISPANEAEGQNTTSASRTKLLENGCDSEISTARNCVKLRRRCRRYRPRNFLEQQNTNAADEMITAV